MKTSYFEQFWQMRKQAEKDINQYISENDTQMMDGQLIVAFETNFDGLQAKSLMQVCKGHIWVSDFEDDEEDAWEEIYFDDILLHSIFNIADAVLNNEHRKDE